MVSETQLRRIIDLAIEELGADATQATVQAVVADVLKEYEKGLPSLALSATRTTAPRQNYTSGRIIVTAFGKNAPGIVSGITSVLAAHGCDLQDVSQKILQDVFTLIMLVDISTSSADFLKLKAELATVSEKLGVQLIAQHEDIFRAMHRV